MQAESAFANHQFLFIISQYAGRMRSRRFDLEIFLNDLFRSAGRIQSLHFLHTDYQGHAASAADAFLQKHGDRAVIYVCGGDGTSHEVVQKLAYTPAHMGVIPVGTANDFAKTLYGRSYNLKSILSGILDPPTISCDLIDVNDEYCLNVTSAGYDTVVLKRAYEILNKRPKLGASAYMLAVLSTLKQIRTVPLQLDFVEVNQRKHAFSAEVMLLALCNGGFYGSGFNPSPDAVLTDGVLEFLHADNLTLRQFLPLMLRYKKGTHLSSPAIHSYRVLKGEITALTEGGLLANYDGVVFTAPKLVFEVRPGALNLWLFRRHRQTI